MNHSEVSFSLRCGGLVLALVVGLGPAVWSRGQSGESVPGDAEAVERVVTGDEVAELKVFDALFTSFVAKHEIPGAAVCISRNGRIVYARGFGYADVEAEEAVQPDSLFRIASVSKPITGAAIMQLVEQEKISLDENPFEVLGYEEVLQEEDVDPRLKQITIRQVLHHTAGWDRGVSFDPMFQYVRISDAMDVPLPPSQQAVIEFMLRQPLDFDPGERYAYSNFGYCVLGRVIEAVTGQTYERYVQENVLEPLGVVDMKIGCSLPEQRAEGEVVYYDAQGRQAAAARDPERVVPFPYRVDFEVLDSNGAWIASAVDLVKFADSLNDPEDCPLLSAGSIETIFARPDGAGGHTENGDKKAVYYGCGWLVRPTADSASTWHMGQVNGTSTLLVRRSDGLNWAVLFNTDETATANKSPALLIDPLMHRAARWVRQWPEPGDS